MFADCRVGGGDMKSWGGGWGGLIHVVAEGCCSATCSPLTSDERGRHVRVGNTGLENIVLGTKYGTSIILGCNCYLLDSHFTEL